MNFKFDITLTDYDYLDYNNFWMFKSHYGKKQMVSYRIIIAAIFAIYVIISLFLNDFASDKLFNLIPIVIVGVLAVVLFPQFLKFGLKNNIKTLKKSGKMAYSPNSVLEFLDETFIETTEDEKTERKYSAIERVSVTEKVIYLHTNNVAAYILPVLCFESHEQYVSFLEFIKSKCNVIDFYK